MLVLGGDADADAEVEAEAVVQVSGWESVATATRYGRLWDCVEW